MSNWSSTTKVLYDLIKSEEKFLSSHEVGRNTLKELHVINITPEQVCSIISYVCCRISLTLQFLFHHNTNIWHIYCMLLICLLKISLNMEGNYSCIHAHGAGWDPNRI